MFSWRDFYEFGKGLLGAAQKWSKERREAVGKKFRFISETLTETALELSAGGDPPIDKLEILRLHITTLPDDFPRDSKTDVDPDELDRLFRDLFTIWSELDPTMKKINVNDAHDAEMKEMLDVNNREELIDELNRLAGQFTFLARRIEP